MDKPRENELELAACCCLNVTVSKLVEFEFAMADLFTEVLDDLWSAAGFNCLVAPAVPLKLSLAVLIWLWFGGSAAVERDLWAYYD